MRQYLDLTSWILLFFFAPFTVLILLSQNTIPGDFFYPVKRGLENMILVAASVSPTTRVAFRTDLTQRRFSEAQQLVALKADTTAFSEFVSDVSTTQEDLSALSSSKDKIENSDKLLAKIDEYQVQLSQVQTQVQIAQAQAPQAQAPPATASQLTQGRVCIQVITYGRNPNTGVCQAFSTPCDVPTGWASCEPSSAGQPTPTPTPTQGPTSAPPQPTPASAIVTPAPVTPTTQTSPPSVQPTSTPPPLTPNVVTVIASNPQKAEQVKTKIADTKEELEKIKVKIKKEKEDTQVKEKIKEEQQQLKEQIKKQEGENKERRNEPTPTPHK